MDLLSEIREHLAADVPGARGIQSLPSEYPGWSISKGVEYGVAIPYDDDAPLSESFANCQIRASKFNIAGTSVDRFLILTCTERDLRYEFATVCAEFLEPGEDGEKRKELLKNPLLWWEKWRELLGNTITDREAYSVIAEMMALDSLLASGKQATWEAVHGGSHDIEAEDFSVEVKSTLRKYETTVTISSQHQLLSDEKQLFLYFCRLESSVHGVSINDMVDLLIKDGYDKSTLEKQLEHLGFEKGTSSRTKRYKCLEKRKYTVDKAFPHITKESFAGGEMPKNITKIEYTVNLDGIDYSEW